MSNLSQSRAAQRQRLLATLRLGSVSTLQARAELDILHPAGRVFELRAMGHDIATYWQWEPTDSGKPHKVGLYVLLSEKQGGKQ